MNGCVPIRSALFEGHNLAGRHELSGFDHGQIRGTNLSPGDFKYYDLFNLIESDLNSLAFGFSITPANPHAPVEITFSPTGPYSASASYQWTFYDGPDNTSPSTISTDKFAKHFYLKDRAYLVELEVTDPAISTITRSRVITVAPPEINVSYPDGRDELKVRVSTPESSHITEYRWQFGDSTAEEYGRQQDHTYATGGWYNVTLTVMLDNGESMTSTKGVVAGTGRIYMPGHGVQGEETWYANSEYIVDGTISINSGAKLTIEPGTKVSFMGNGSLQAYGALLADGVTFTAEDGASPWRGIALLNGGASASRLANCVVEGAAGTNPMNFNASGAAAAIQIVNASPTISGCTIRGTGGAPTGIFAYHYGAATAPTVTNNTVTGFGYAGVFVYTSGGLYQGNRLENNAVGLRVYYTAQNPVIQSNTYANNAQAAVAAMGAISSLAVQWDATGAPVYLIEGLGITDNGSLTIGAGSTVKLASELSINSGSSLTLGSGSTVQIAGNGSLQAYGALLADGVTFTAEDGASPWRGIALLNGGASASRLANCVVEGAAGTNPMNFNASGAAAAIQIVNASPTISGCTIRGTGGAPTGIFAYHYGAATAPTVTNNTVTGFGYAGVFVYTSGGLYQGNTLGGNAYGLRYSGSEILNAANNNWGDPTGPLDDSDDRASGGLYNPTALGSRVSDRVNYYPWTGTPPALTATPGGFAATPQNGALALRWNANTETALGGYKLYYGTTAGNYGTPVVLGKVATHTLTGLSNGRTYYLALSSLNSIGVESARTAEITATPTATSTYTLTVAKAGTGSGTVTGPGIDCGSDCTENYTSGTSVTLSATATTSSTFTGWNGGGCSGTGNCAVTIDVAKTVTANFTAIAPTTYALTVSKTGTGSGTVTSNPAGINCGSDCTESYASGTSVALTATPASGSSFTGWSGTCTGTGSCTVTMSAAKSVTATFNLLNAATLRISDVSKAEGNTGATASTFTVTLSPASTSTVTVKYATANGTATAGSDYTAVPATLLTFTPGQTSKTVTVNVTGDTAKELNETFFINLSAPTGATIADPQGSGTILNDDGPVLRVNDVSKAEGSAGNTPFIFTVTLSPASTSTVTVKYATANGTAAAGSDYTAVPATLLTFAPGQTSQTVTANVMGNTTVEPNETFAVNLSAASGATIFDSQGVGTILNDDGPVLRINDVSKAESNSGASPLAFAVTLSPASASPVTVKYATANGTATAGSDYTAANGTLTFAPGQTSQTVTVNVMGNTTVEPNETFAVNLSAASGATIFDSQGVGTILNDDGPVLRINDVSKAEGNAGTTAFTFTVTLSPASTGPVTVKYATANGTALAGSDYTAASGTLTFAAEQTSQTVTVNATGDTTVEANETFVVNLSAASGATIFDSQGVGTILNND